MKFRVIHGGFNGIFVILSGLEVGALLSGGGADLAFQVISEGDQTQTPIDDTGSMFVSICLFRL